MKTKCILVLFCITFVKFFSQPYFGKHNTKDLPKVDFTLTDGSTVTGFLVGYTYPNGTYCNTTNARNKTRPGLG